MSAAKLGAWIWEPTDPAWRAVWDQLPEMGTPVLYWKVVNSAAGITSEQAQRALLDIVIEGQAHAYTANGGSWVARGPMCPCGVPLRKCGRHEIAGGIFKQRPGR